MPSDSIIEKSCALIPVPTENSERDMTISQGGRPCREERGDTMALSGASATARVAQFEVRRMSRSADEARLSITPCAEGAQSNVVILAVPAGLEGTRTKCR